MSKNDITGQRFGHWTALKRDDSYKSNKHSKWICQCDCGTIKSIFKTTLNSGRSTSCGCIVYHNYGINQTHGMSKTRLYHIWLSMRRRCSEKDKANAERYSKRGIRVCDEWQKDFTPFYNWAMKNGYSDSLTIDRIDNDKGYYPENCRWITIAEQQSNKSNNVHVLYNGEEWCLRTLCQKINFPYKTAHKRYQRITRRGEEPTQDKLFCPIKENRIAFRFRKSV